MPGTIAGVACLIWGFLTSGSAGEVASPRPDPIPIPAPQAPREAPKRAGPAAEVVIIAGFINESRKGAGKPELKPSPALTAEAKAIVDRFVRGRQRPALAGETGDADALKGTLKGKGYDAADVATSVVLGSADRDLPGALRTRDGPVARLALGDWTDVGAARGPGLGGREFCVIIYGRSAGKGAAPAVSPAGGAAYPPAGTPEDAVRTFLAAAVVGDVATLRKVVQETPDFDRLTRAEKPPAGAIPGLRAEVLKTPVRVLKPGDVVSLPRGRQFTVADVEVGPSDAVCWPEGAPTPFRVKKIAGAWRVDAGPLIAGRKAADSARRKAGR